MDAQLKDETICDIIAVMRDYSNACNDGYHTDYGVVRTDMRNFADRLDRARMKMEIEIANLRKENAKLREALVTIQNCDISKEEDCITLYRVCYAALAAPQHLEAASLQDAPAN